MLFHSCVFQQNYRISLWNIKKGISFERTVFSNLSIAAGLNLVGSRKTNRNRQLQKKPYKDLRNKNRQTDETTCQTDR
jgi:hypothetical protein